jgi:hypothetical protein
MVGENVVIMNAYWRLDYDRGLEFFLDVKLNDGGVKRYMTTQLGT